ncbi:MAG: GNAT family N-acetyltransferase [Maricaulaceae bacterium]|jgi:lipid II:glycine glycyltransferase (peptidoglycan interpeptide bridge formation enzyme)
MHVSWNDADRKTWDAAHASAAAALQQDWCYGEALGALDAKVIRASIWDGSERIGLAQVICRRIGFVFTLGLSSRGPVWLAPLAPERKALAYRALKRAFPAPQPRALIVSPDETSSEGPRAADLGLGALARVMTGYSTVIVDLERDLDDLRARLEGKWRNRLAAAERAGLAIARGGVKPRQYAWLLEKESGQRAVRGYRALPTGFVEAYAEAKGAKDALLVLRAGEDRDPIAGMMFLIHGEAASYHIGWSSDEGRKAGAHNVLLWRGVEMLRERGVRRLDLGGVNTQSGAGLARFKIGVGGEVVTYAGSYV